MRPIAIDRKAGHRSVNQLIEQGKERLSRGIWLTVFPEGTRMSLGKTRRYGVSGAALAKAAQCKIVPVAHNAGDFWPRRGFKKNPELFVFVSARRLVQVIVQPKKLILRFKIGSKQKCWK